VGNWSLSQPWDLGLFIDNTCSIKKVPCPIKKLSPPLGECLATVSNNELILSCLDYVKLEVHEDDLQLGVFVLLAAV